jgi:hypothetical protein
MPVDVLTHTSRARSIARSAGAQGDPSPWGLVHSGSPRTNARGTARPWEHRGVRLRVAVALGRPDQIRIRSSTTQANGKGETNG